MLLVFADSRAQAPGDRRPVGVDRPSVAAQPSSAADRAHRGCAPWPGASTSFRGQTCQIWAEPFSLPTLTGSAPGTISREDTQILIACGHATLLRLLSVKVEGRKQISAVEFANGARLTERERFENA